MVWSNNGLLHRNDHKCYAAKYNTMGQSHKLYIHSKKQNTKEQTQGDLYFGNTALPKQSWKRPRHGPPFRKGGAWLSVKPWVLLGPALLAPKTRGANSSGMQLSTCTAGPAVLLRPPLRTDSCTYFSFPSAWPWLNPQEPDTERM